MQSARRSADPERLGRVVRWAGLRLGAHAIGYAALDERWLYAEVHRNHSLPTPPETQPIAITDTPYPRESEAGLEIPASMNRVVAIAVPMDRDLMATAPSLLAEAATSLGYSLAAQVSISLAELIRQMGYNAIPSLNGTGLSIPLAVQAGLGECARNGLLVTPGLGACVRLAKVITDMPLPLAAPVDLGVRRYCATCRACAKACPAQAIAHGEPTPEGHNECNIDGVRKWHVNAKQCLRYWTASGTSCSVCIAVCPFTQGRRWGLGLPQWLIRRTTAFNRPLAWLDRVTPRASDARPMPSRLASTRWRKATALTPQPAWLITCPDRMRGLHQASPERISHHARR